MFRREELQEIRALTPMQQGMLHHALLEPASSAYHEQLAARLDGLLDADALLAAWQLVVDRHEALRGRFVAERTSRPAHLVPRHEPLHLSWHDRDNDSGEGSDGLPVELADFLAEDRARPFKLSQEHPMRLALIHCGPARHWLVWSFHHILLDGWSINVVLNEVLHAYRTMASGSTPDLTPPPSYHLYQNWLSSRDQEAAVAYWRRQLAGYDDAGLLSVANTFASTSFAAKEKQARIHQRIAVSGKCWQTLKALVQNQRATLHHLLVAAWAVAVGRFVNRRDVVIGTVVAGRPAEIERVEHLVGLCINTLPFRVRWAAEESFSQLLDRVRDDHLAAAAHVHVTLAEFGTAQGSPVDHLLLVQNLPYENILGPVTADLSLSEIIFEEQTPYGLEVTATPASDQLILEWRHSTAGIPAAQVVALAQLTECVLGAIAAAPQQPLADLDVLGEHLGHLLQWGDGGLAPVSRGTILELFAAQVAARPEALALVASDGQFTYRQLDQAANRLAHTLLARCPLATNDRVALVAERDSLLLVGLLAILKTGAAYVPVDPDFPPERVRVMLADSGCRLVLAAPSLLADIASPVPVLSLTAASATAPATAPDSHSGPDALAYVIFTSGSTGRPKGAQLLQRNAAAFFSALPGAFGFTPQSRILALTTISFDIAGLELLGALCCGMTVVLATTAQARDPAQVFALVAAENIQVLQLTPTRLKLLLEEGDLSSLASVQTLLVGGEALPRHLAERLACLPAIRAFNVYGPSETTIWSAAQLLTGGPVSLGRALPGERLFVLSAEHRLQPVGAVGEIAIAGDGVGSGYLDQPEKTAERFVSIPALASGPVYLTGDLGRWRPDGSLEFLGRLDHQIKIRGTRVEPGEVEHHLRRENGIDDALVIARKAPDGETELIAYLVSHDPAVRVLDTAFWRTRLALTLPDAMIPARFTVLDALPQTPNGKIDRRALPNPDLLVNPLPSRAPANPIELAIITAFASVLHQHVGPEDDFFASGGHSLMAMQVIGRINRELKSTLRLKDLYLDRTAATLAARVAGKPAAVPIVSAAEASDYPLSYAQQALWVLDQVNPGHAGYNVPGAYRLIGPLKVEALQQAWAAVIGRHESLRTTFHAGTEEPRQRIQSATPFTIERHDCRRWPAAAVAEKAAEITNRPFNLATGPLFRLALLTTDGATHLLVLVTHHIITDGWSDQILARDLAIAYGAAVAGNDPFAALAPPPPLRYRDFAVWQRQTLTESECEKHLAYWRQRLTDLVPLNLPTDRPRQARGPRRGSRVSLVDGLPALPGGRRFAVLVAATAALLHAESRQTDICLGVPVAGRERPELQDQVGFHLNLLPLRLRFTANDTLEDLERLAATAIVEAMEHTEYPFACLVEALGLATAAGRHPVFDALLIVHQHATPLPRLAGLQVELAPQQSYTSRYDLDFEAWADDEGIRGFIEYDSDLFDQSRMALLADRWRTTLKVLEQNPGTTLTGLRREFIRSSSPDTAHFVAQTLALDEEF